MIPFSNSRWVLYTNSRFKFARERSRKEENRERKQSRHQIAMDSKLHGNETENQMNELI